MGESVTFKKSPMIPQTGNVETDVDTKYRCSDMFLIIFLCHETHGCSIADFKRQKQAYLIGGVVFCIFFPGL